VQSKTQTWRRRGSANIACLHWPAVAPRNDNGHLVSYEAGDAISGQIVDLSADFGDGHVDCSAQEDTSELIFHKRQIEMEA
jgi:hypothetical protein